MIRAQKYGHRPDYFLIVTVILLTIAGLVILASASSALGKTKFDDPYYYLKHQAAIGFSVGILGFWVGSRVSYQWLKKLAFPLLLLNLGLLTLVFTSLGISSGGASRWLKLGPLPSFQPSELLKITFVIYLAAWLSNPKFKRSQGFWDGLLPFFIICGLVAGLLVLQPATSTVFILLASGGIMYFLSGAPWKYISLAIAIGIAALLLLIFVTPYRWQRIATFLNPETDRLGAGYQVNQAQIAIGLGGWWGTGYGQSAGKIHLPTAVDDSIFAVAAQELGFIGASLLAILFASLVFRLIWLANSIRDKFGQQILFGFASIIALQSLVNMGAISGLFPLTGVPLPFISYGGTALAMFLTMSGIAINISKYS